MPKEYSRERDDGVPDTSETRSLHPQGISTSGMPQHVHDVSVGWVLMINSVSGHVRVAIVVQGRKLTARLP